MEKNVVDNVSNLIDVFSEAFSISKDRLERAYLEAKKDMLEEEHFSSLLKDKDLEEIEKLLKDEEANDTSE